MNKFIGICGLDCKICKARLATINNDDNLRKTVAEKWSILNDTNITPEMVNCQGCRIDGIKTVYCEKLCIIRQCAIENKFETCGDCDKVNSCDKLKFIIDHSNEDVLNNLKTEKEKK